ncbi:MAG: hypothetical protein HYX63_07120 [Gammaproteobacteria bacterium]|nr:hypothetical protein [Gammaproteobacteria bacterium]
MSTASERDEQSAPIEPYSLDSNAASAVSRDRGRNPLLLASAVIGLLAIGVGMVLFGLPHWVEPGVTASPPAVTASLPAPTDTPTTPTTDSATPLIPEPPEARPAAQDALATLLPALDALRAQRVETWGADTYQAALAKIADGEKAYREQRYTAARMAYQSASEGLATLRAKIPQVVSDYLDEGQRALLSHNARAAETAFTAALALAPTNSAAQRGVARADAFDKAMALLDEAHGYERMGDTARAAETYRAVLKLDPEIADARQALAKIETARNVAAFSQLMSTGFTALNTGDYGAARSAFEAARKLDPRAREAANALAQTQSRATAAQIESAMTAAHRAEQSERWPEAAAQFRKALSVDKGIEAASMGAARAERRAVLETRLLRALKDPERLADNAVYQEAVAVRDAAQLIATPGPRLRQQLVTLSDRLRIARTPVAINLKSNGATAITILKVGAIGTFTAHQLTLFPGRYTALGQRNGYRDVRQEFSVAAEAGPLTLIVQCEEPVPFGR